MSQINLMFHDVKLNPSRWNTKPNRFEELMKIIFEHHNASKVVITVDDAGKGNHEYMLPVFEKYGIKSHIFVPTKFISDGIKASSYMNAIQIKEFSDLGHIVGSHSHSHPRNISLLGKEQIENEWSLSKDILENITGKPVVSCAIPGGFYSNVQMEILKKLGYELIFNSVPTFDTVTTNHIALSGRFSIERNTSNYQMNLILNMNFFNQQKLKIRQSLSQTIHTIKHRLN